MDNRVVVGKRRFSCITPRLVRMEFAPDGVFEERRSLVAYAPQEPIPFEKVCEEGGVLTLEAGGLTIVSRSHDKAFFSTNLETRWWQHGLQQYWRPGDKDHRNLGGTVRALDRIDRDTMLAGVHIADMESPDAKANIWLSWLQDEDDPPYYKESRQRGTNRAGLNVDLHASARYAPENLLTRTVNHVLDQHKYAPGVLSRSGYFFLNDSLSAVLDEEGFPIERDRPGYEDWYFFAYKDDYQAALADFITLAGRAPLPTKNTFGLIFSRWPAYDETEAKEIVAEFERQQMPLSALVLDMEWHKEGWEHWDWDEKFYPDPRGFFDWAHGKGLDITLNVHPLRVRDDDSHFEAYLEAAGTTEKVRPYSFNEKELRVVDVDLANKREARAFMSVCHDEIVEQGLDYWWVDGCRGTLNGATDQLLTNKIYFENVATDDKRGMLLSRYGGYGSHRYGVYFTGDTYSCWETLATQCEFNIRAGHIGMGYISHDMGGFVTFVSAPRLDPEIYLRWTQFGVFNPVFRFHSSPGSGSRQPWDYGEKCLEIAKHWLQVRQSLIPYIYSAAREHFETGTPIVRGLFLERPQDERAYRFDEFMFGPSLLVAPVLSSQSGRDIYLPEGEWFEFSSGEIVSGGTEFHRQVAVDAVPVYVKVGSILLRQPIDAPPTDAHTQCLQLDVYPGADGSAVLYEDDGRSPQYQQGAYCKTEFSLTDEGKTITITGKIREGEPLGKTREISLDLHLPEAPSRVIFAGAELPCETLEKPNRYRIKLPEMPTGEEFAVIIRR